jgi:hypothetical protein
VTRAGYVRRGADSRGASYSVVVPPGFIRIPGGASPETALALVLDQLAVTEALPEFETRFVDAMRRAGEADAHHAVLDTFVTAGPLSDVGVACSVVFAAVLTVASEHSDLDRLLLARISGGASALVVGGDPAVAWELEAPVLAEPERVLRRRAVLSRVVGHDDLLVSIVCTVVGDEGPELPRRREVADALVELFDAMLTTVRWRDDRGLLITDRPVS